MFGELNNVIIEKIAQQFNEYNVPQKFISRKTGGARLKSWGVIAPRSKVQPPLELTMLWARLTVCVKAPLGSCLVRFSTPAARCSYYPTGTSFCWTS